jgi:hypothetical protein
MILKNPGETSLNQTSPSPTMKPSGLGKGQREEFSSRIAAVADYNEPPTCCNGMPRPLQRYAPHLTQRNPTTGDNRQLKTASSRRRRKSARPRTQRAKRWQREEWAVTHPLPLNCAPPQRCHPERTGPRTFFSSGVVREGSAVAVPLQSPPNFRLGGHPLESISNTVSC